MRNESRHGNHSRISVMKGETAFLTSERPLSVRKCRLTLQLARDAEPALLISSSPASTCWRSS